MEVKLEREWKMDQKREDVGDKVFLRVSWFYPSRDIFVLLPGFLGFPFSKPTDGSKTNCLSFLKKKEKKKCPKKINHVFKNKDSD